MGRLLYKSRKNKVITGVCGGFAEYFGIDPTIIRIICIILGLSGTGVLAYIVAAIIMPDEDKVRNSGDDWKSGPVSGTDDFSFDCDKEKDDWDRPANYNTEKNRLVFGAVLVGLGVLFLGKQLLPWFDMKYLVPILLIGIGGFIVVKGRQ